MIKFIVPAIILFLLVIFWEKINKKIYKKFNVKIDYILISITLLIIATILALLYF